MPLQTLTLADVLLQIKRESRVKGADNLDDMITHLINETLLEETYNHRYHQFLVLNSAVALTAASGGPYNYPVDYQEIRMVRYQMTSGYVRILRERNAYVEQSDNGGPKFYESVGDTFVIFPFTSILATDQILIDYYKYPTQLVAPTDIFPIPKLLAGLKTKVIARVHIYNKDMQSAQFFTGKGAEAVERARTGEEE